jgi:hypothetical protein
MNNLIDPDDIDQTVQLRFTLDFEPLKQLPKEVRPQTRKERFEAFHMLNPHVYKNLVHMVQDDFNAGVGHMSIQFYMESLRRGAIRTSGDKWKINNSYGAFYARKIMSEYPHLQGYFEIRTRRKGK